jgi:hypothetical protein
MAPRTTIFMQDEDQWPTEKKKAVPFDDEELEYKCKSSWL